MYGVKQLKFDSTYPDPACDACNNKHLSLFSLGEYCKVYDNKANCFSDLAKDQIHLCKECIFALRKTKVYQMRCINAQNFMQSYVNYIHREYLENPRDWQRIHEQYMRQPPVHDFRPEILEINPNGSQPCLCPRC